MALSQLKVLTTRTRIVAALVVTAYVLAVAIRGALNHHVSKRLLIDWFFGLNGWALVALNVAFYAYLCWLAFCFIKGTEGRERLFMVCWFIGILLWPLRTLRPHWSTAEHYVSSIALAMALCLVASLFWAREDELRTGGAS